MSNRNKRYTLINFAFDALLTVISGGLWLIFVAIREWRRR